MLFSTRIFHMKIAFAAMIFARVPSSSSCPLKRRLATTSAAFAVRSPRAISSDDSSLKDESRRDDKTVTFIRHGCTYMNEYLGGSDGGSYFGSPSFTDVFADESRRSKYQDSPLSPRGRQQAIAMSQHQHDFVSDCGLVVVSPLTRALQTFDLGLRPHFVRAEVEENRNDPVPVVALPEAAERLYLISDVGRHVHKLQLDYDYVDFQTGVVDRQHDPERWWYRPDDGSSYVEWRPVGKGQRYACPGEPLEAFYQRMSRLYSWLDERPESHIAVVCHHGVIDAFLDCDFDNCQYRSVKFASLAPSFLTQAAGVGKQR